MITVHLDITSRNVLCACIFNMLSEKSKWKLLFSYQVLDKKRGLPITLAVLYESIARRLGLKCEPISFPAHFLLRFTEGIEMDGDSYYIDVFNNGDIIRRGSCPHSQMANQNREPFPVATAQQVNLVLLFVSY